MPCLLFLRSLPALSSGIYLRIDTALAFHYCPIFQSQCLQCSASCSYLFRPRALHPAPSRHLLGQYLPPPRPAFISSLGLVSCSLSRSRTPPPYRALYPAASTTWTQRFIREHGSLKAKSKRAWCSSTDLWSISTDIRTGLTGFAAKACIYLRMTSSGLAALSSRGETMANVEAGNASLPT